MSISGVTMAFTRGWTFSFVLLGIFPIIILATTLMGKVMQAGFVENMIAYSQSAGYAEQALNSIRVVAAFGQESKEIKNYEKYLGIAQKAGIKSHCKIAFVIGFFFFAMFASYAYAFYLGSIWVEKQFYNSTFDRPYHSGDIISCFFGILFGMFSLGMAAPNIKAVTEGRIAAKMAFDIIDRVPSI